MDHRAVEVPSNCPNEWKLLQASVLMGIIRAPFLLVYYGTNELRKSIDDLLARCHRKSKESFCECVLVNGSSYCTSKVAYKLIVDRLESTAGMNVIDCSALEAGFTGDDLLGFIIKKCGKRDSSNRCKSLREITQQLSENYVIVLPHWTEDILSKRSFETVKSDNQALLYTLLDLTHKPGPGTWTVILFVTQPRFLETASHKVQSRLGIKMTSLEHSMTQAQMDDFLELVRKYIYTVWRKLLGSNRGMTRRATRASPVGDFLTQYFSQMKANLRIHFCETISVTTLVQLVSVSLSAIVQYDYEKKTIMELNPRTICLAYPSAPRFEPPDTDIGTTSVAAKVKRASLLTPAIDRSDIRSEWEMFAHAGRELRLRCLFWRRLPLIDLCILLSWVNLHNNESLNYICGDHLQKNCQPHVLSPTSIVSISFRAQAVALSIHYLLRAKILLISQAQWINDNIEKQTYEEDCVTKHKYPFMHRPLTFPRWEEFCKFLGYLQKLGCDEYPSWLRPQTDKKVKG